MQFKKATKQQAKLRMALIGPSGSGKTYSALNIGQHLGKRIALIDTERGSASKYADLFQFDVLELESFEPQTYVKAIEAATEADYDVLIIDSLSHAWMGKGGALEQVDRAAKRMNSSNSFAAWRDVTPIHNALVDAMVGVPVHLIATIRSKMDFSMDKDDKGKTVITKLGMQPIQRDGVEYEFDVVADMHMDNTLVVSKTRCTALTGESFAKPGQDVADILNVWLSDGTPYEQKQTGHILDGSKPEYKPEPAPTPNGKRPYSGEVLFNKLQEFAQGYEQELGDDTASKAICQMLAGCLDKAFGGRERRGVITNALFGFESTGTDNAGTWESNVMLCQAKALFKWLGVPDGAFEPAGKYWQMEAANLYAFIAEQLALSQLQAGDAEGSK